MFNLLVRARYMFYFRYFSSFHHIGNVWAIFSIRALKFYICISSVHINFVGHKYIFSRIFRYKVDLVSFEKFNVRFDKSPSFILTAEQKTWNQPFKNVREWRETEVNNKHVKATGLDLLTIVNNSTLASLQIRLILGHHRSGSYNHERHFLFSPWSSPQLRY